MNQAKFVYMSKKMNPISVTDDGNGKIIVTLRKSVRITHNYKKNDRMEIEFVDSGSAYVIPSENELEVIYRMHLEHTNFIQQALKYCQEHLESIK